MKKYVYKVSGALDTASMAPLCDALCELPMVDRATIEKNEETLLLSLTYKSDFSGDELKDMESIVSSCLSKRDLVLELPALADTYVALPAPPKGRSVPLSAAIGAMITAIVLAVLCTFAVMTMTATRSQDVIVNDETGETEEENRYEAVDLLDDLFKQNSPYYESMEDEAVIRALLDGYIAASGDLYAEYYDADEYADLNAGYKGEMCGIGVQVVNGLINVNGVQHQAVIIANVYADSPAEEAGVLPGDAIMYVGLGENAALVNTIGYTEALNRMSGEEGSLCEFTVYRAPLGQTENVTYEQKDFSITRRKLTVQSVSYRVCDTDASVGIVRIYEFDFTTASQLSDALDALKNEGCTDFVLDLRGNPGGLLTSVVDVLTFFLNEGDVVLSAKDKYDREEIIKVGAPNEKGFVTSGTGTLKASDIGKYRDLNISVLVNEYSASAAELFTANIRDYELGKIVGVTTYGKGSMQSTFSLASYGYEGALKLTTKFYFPPCGEGYDGIGITPHVEIPLSDEAKQYHINLLPHDKDNQLQAAIQALKS